MPSSQLTHNPHSIINKRKIVLVFFSRQCALSWVTARTINCPAAVFCSLPITSEHSCWLWLCCAVWRGGISRRAAFTQHTLQAVSRAAELPSVLLSPAGEPQGTPNAALSARAVSHCRLLQTVSTQAEFTLSQAEF